MRSFMISKYHIKNDELVSKNLQILCYGDSNTWGQDPETGRRIPWPQRWPGVMARSLNSNYRVIEEALPGRTWETELSGMPLWIRSQGHLSCSLISHQPLHVVILAVGTNEIWQNLQPQIKSVVEMYERALTEVRQISPDAFIYIITPPVWGKSFVFEDQFTTQKLIPALRQLSDHTPFELVDCYKEDIQAGFDGVHLDISMHLKLGKKMSKTINSNSLFPKNSLQ